MRLLRSRFLTALRRRGRTLDGGAAFTLLECLVYMSVLAIIFVVLAIGYYRADHNNRDLSRTSAEILGTLQAGERWREDVRTATGPIAANAQEISIPHGGGPIRYGWREGKVWRQVSPAGVWQEVLPGVARSEMTPDKRNQVAAWRWEVELETHRKNAHVKPLFSFLAVEGKP